MNRTGHVGLTLLAFAPVAYILVSEGHLALAVLSWGGIQAVEPLPDQDFHLPGLTHRGVSHSLFAALVVGSVLGAGGWFLGQHLFDLLLGVLSGGTDSLVRLVGLFPDPVGPTFADLVRSITPATLTERPHQQFGESVDHEVFALFGFVIGVCGVCAHLLGDLITVRGIRPLLPISHRRVSLSPLRADNPMANTALFGLGILAILVVLGATVPSAGLGPSVPSAPTDLSPVDVAAGQGQSATQTQNQTSLSVEFANQTTNGSTVTVARVTLSEAGFIALHGSEYLNPAPADASIIAVSPYLSAGSHRNVTIDVSHAPPGNYLGLNRSALNTSQTLVAAIYTDSNSNQRFEYVQSANEDPPLTSNGSAVSDPAMVRVLTPNRTLASVEVTNQTLQNNTLVVSRARLPDGGFLVAHNTSYQRTGDPLTSAVGRSEYLAPGNHSNVTVRVRSGSLTQTQAVTIRPTKDTNDNQRYDYLRSHGLEDTGYLTANRSTTVNTTALVRVPSERATWSRRQSLTTTSPAPITPPPPSQPITATATATPPPPPIQLSSSTEPAPTATSPRDASGTNGSSGVFGEAIAGLVNGPIWLTGGLALVVVAVGLSLVGRWT